MQTKRRATWLRTCVYMCCERLSEQPNHCEPAGKSAGGSADHFNKAVKRRARTRAAYLHERESSCEVPFSLRDRDTNYFSCTH
jgi:hypothetical protein